MAGVMILSVFVIFFPLHFPLIFSISAVTFHSVSPVSLIMVLSPESSSYVHKTTQWIHSLNHLKCPSRKLSPNLVEKVGSISSAMRVLIFLDFCSRHREWRGESLDYHLHFLSWLPQTRPCNKNILF